MTKNDAGTAPNAIKHMPALPLFTRNSPAVVLAHDKIRDKLKEVEGFEEFCWFAREYPRCYRFHFKGAEFRLQSLHGLLQEVRDDLVGRISSPDSGIFELGLSDIRVERVYWDFEAFLSEVSIALDLLARVVSPAFRDVSPPSFNKLCKWKCAHPLLDVFRRAQTRWANRLKDYRDCFTHYTPVDTCPMVILRRYSGGWEIRARLPTNPNMREILRFRFSRRVDLLRYALHVHRAILAFDRAVARTISGLYRRKEYPVRKDSLFFVGRRKRS